MKTKHTETPWEPVGSHRAWFIRTVPKVTPGEIVAVHESTSISEIKECNPDEMKANAQFIVQACNHHDELVEALREAYFQFEHNGDESDADKAVLNKIQSLLTKLKG